MSANTPNSSGVRSKWLKPGFLTVVFLLASCTVGLYTAVASLKLSFIKEAVPLKQELTSVPSQMGDWLQVSVDEPIDKETEDQLATKLYIFRDYVNTKLLTAADIERFNGKTSAERKFIAAQLQAARPEAVLNLAVTYYTGKVDTVAHIPERCYVADGYQYTDTPETLQWNMGPGRLGKSPTDPQTVAVRFLNFEDQTGAGKSSKRVAYFFFANGRYESDNLRVRQSLANLRYKHGFYSKVELMGVIPDHDQCAAVMSSFLASVMPQVEKCYPDWNSVEYGANQSHSAVSSSIASVK